MSGAVRGRELITPSYSIMVLRNLLTIIFYSFTLYPESPAAFILRKGELNMYHERFTGRHYEIGYRWGPAGKT